MQEMPESWVGSLVQEDPLEEEVVTHSSILAWEIPWTEEPGGIHSMGSQRVGQGCEHTCTHTHRLLTMVVPLVAEHRFQTTGFGSCLAPCGMWDLP